MNLFPPLSPTERLASDIQDNGYAIASAQSVAELAGISLADLNHLHLHWQDLPRDPYLKDGGRYRFRRHASYTVTGSVLEMVPHRAHWQSLDYNALHGGIERWFEPITDALAKDPTWQALLKSMAVLLSGLKPVKTWFVEAHQFRIDTSDGIGRPTPEGAHRDGVDFVAVFLVDRQGIKGGETRIFEVNTAAGLRFTLIEPWSVLLMNDERMIHETTPIQPTRAHGYRDTLVVTFRSSGFQDSPKNSPQ
ncbi:MAG: 2OG-Fe dioxygenase family protein [Polynucleobacter sp.]|nr:2OG-Fe dioxygenase family protein [Polynucleobacter sp.]MDZ4056350.1 2OG-Fe dioxygenase family protein [Polynucleobacter sp.]